MGPTKAPSRDGFPTFLFQKCWHIMGNERDGLSQWARTNRNGPCIANLLFTDNCILFGEASLKGAKDLMMKKSDNQSTQFLSKVGKEVFIKAVLQALPTYTMACIFLPNLFVMRWRVLWLGFGGKRLMVKEEFIGVNGGNCVSPRMNEV
ncbi:hypothetical protein J1N35_000562 [Gossypium stocksii]|uniref:Uncharacterized protein n=1 Tax=Gossypium stocksii TaxID=47602 RepID=A0A9D4AL58_9ROSI|nr:hypothetical protein J1N35_000562 [Gossypium stocksii]